MQWVETIVMKTLHGRAKRNFSFVRPFIEGNAVLDIGAAEGWTGGMIKRDAPHRDVHLLDVADFNQTDLPLTLYDGQTFPFEDNSFDTSLLLLILHHCTDPDRVLSEALRVTRKRLIITESVYNFQAGRAMLFVADNIVNGLRSHSRMAKGLNFCTTEEWEARFSQMDVSLRYKEWISKGFHKHILYVLDIGKEAFRPIRLVLVYLPVVLVLSDHLIPS